MLSFDATTAQVLREGSALPEPVGGIFRLLWDTDNHANAASLQISTPAQRGLVAHLSGLNAPHLRAAQATWYREAERIELTKRHCDHLIKSLQATSL